MDVAKYSPIGEGVRSYLARLVQTRMIQVHVRNHAGSSPVIRTTKGDTN